MNTDLQTLGGLRAGHPKAAELHHKKTEERWHRGTRRPELRGREDNGGPPALGARGPTRGGRGGGSGGASLRGAHAPEGYCVRESGG